MFDLDTSGTGMRIGETGSSYLRELISRGEYLRAYELGDILLKKSDGPDKAILKLHSLCMSRLGMTDRAISLLESLEHGPKEADSEIFALLGSFYKRKWLELKDIDPAAAGAFLSSSFRNYMRSRELGCDYWCVINAATLALLMGRAELGLELADEVIEECWEKYNRHGTSSEYWIPASMGEAHLIKAEYDTAVRWYTSARSHLCGRIGQIKPARVNAAVIIEILGVPEETERRVLEAIGKPRIIVFGGHRVDRPDRESPRFPDRISGRVRSRIKKTLVELRPDLGIASAADGADLLFHECLQKMGKCTHVVLPAPVGHFRKNLITSDGERWQRRFDKVIERAHRVEVSSSSLFYSKAEGSYQLATDYLIEYADELSETYDGDMIPVVLWDERSTGHPGGTGYMVSSFRQMGKEPVRISTEDLVRSSASPGSDGSEASTITYEKRGIYEPSARPMFLISPMGETVLEEVKASDLSRILAHVSQLCSDRSIRILNAACISNRVFMLINSVLEAWNLYRELCKPSSSLPAMSLVMHSGMAIMLDSSITGRRDYYCREMTEALEVADTLRVPERLVTMQFRAMLKHTPGFRSDAGFLYHGLLKTSEGSTLKLYRLQYRQ